MEAHARLFRAIVVLGAAITAPACDEHGNCPPPATCAPTDAMAANDARSDARAIDAPPPDAPDDAVIIL